MIATIIILYIIGCVLSYLRFTAADCSWLLKIGYRHRFIPKQHWVVREPALAVTLILLSWVGFLIGIVEYYRCDDKYFLCYNYDNLC